MNYIELDENYNVVTPLGTLFIEKRPNADLWLCETANTIYDADPVLTLTNQTTGDVMNIILQLEPVEEAQFYTAKTAIAEMDCGVYKLSLEDKHIITFTISPQFTNIEMMTIFSEEIHSILDKVDQLPYNWLHMTPLPKAGPSKSCYSMDGFTEYYLLPQQLEKLRCKNILIDVVLNHLAPTARELVNINNTYNNFNRPDLKPAEVLDFHLQILNHYAANGMGFSEIMQQLEKMLGTIKVYEYELINEKKCKKEQIWSGNVSNLDLSNVAILNGKRHGAVLNTDYLKSQGVDEIFYATVAHQYNEFVVERFEDEKREICKSLEGSVRYELSRGSKYIFTNYFCVVTDANARENCNEKFYEELHDKLEASGTYEDFVAANGDLLAKIEDDQYVLAATNGWVMGTAIKFVDPAYRVYNKRGLIAWGDCVKLNYDDNEPLEQEAINYVVEMAKMFQGLRIDNAHSTDRGLLAKCISEARKVNKDLLVMLEVFTGSAEQDSIFTQDVGGDLIVKEMIHYNNVEQLCGLPTILSVNSGLNVIGDFQPIERKILRRGVPCMLFDYTHDNQPAGSEQHSHGPGNQLCYAAIGISCEGVAFSTTYGTDLGIWKQILVTDQTPCYRDFDKFTMHEIRGQLLRIKQELTDYTRVYAHNHGNFMTVERMNEQTMESYIFVIMPDFRHYFIETIRFSCEGDFDRIVFHGKCRCQKDDAEDIQYQGQVLHDMFVIDTEHKGLRFKQCSPHRFEIEIDFQPGEVLIFKKKIPEVNSYIAEFLPQHLGQLKEEMAKFNITQWKSFCAMVSEEDDEFGIHKYTFGDVIPTICSFDGIRDCILRTANSGPVAQNLRQGDWLFDYMKFRHEKLGIILPSFDVLIDQLKGAVPASFKPMAAFELFKLTDGIVDETICQQYKLRSVLQSKLFRAALVLVGFRPQWCNVDRDKWTTREFETMLVRLVGEGEQADCTQLEAQAVENLPSARRDRRTRLVWKLEAFENLQPGRFLDVSIAAGYPHFLTGMFRSWGRDINLSISGIMLPYSKAASRVIIVSTASLLRHGLLPNLEDSGRKPRYNCRDAIWYWMAALSQFVQRYGDSILEDKVRRVFSSDREEDYTFDTQKLQFVRKDGAAPVETTVRDVVIEALTKHYQGISFTEWDCHDENMKPQGKHVTAYVDEQTGIVYGGNQYNCHTWMDKMGGSDQFGNRGIPSTPRHGAAVEINLCCLFSLEVLHQKLDTGFITSWYNSLKSNIMKFKIKKGGMAYLRDCLDSEEFRPNYLIGLSYFDSEYLRAHFRDEIVQAFSVLLEPNSIGMKTLAPSDPRYVSWYNNNDSTSYQTAKGFSYHNGPEWVHCMGKALLCAKKVGETALVDKRMMNIAKHIYEGCYINGAVKSLPELTQGDGHICWDSCNSQAWALGCVMEALSWNGK